MMHEDTLRKLEDDRRERERQWQEQQAERARAWQLFCMIFAAGMGIIGVFIGFYLKGEK